MTKRDLANHGFTEDCPQCEHIRAYGDPRPGQTHSPTCRARVMHEVGKTALGQARLAKAEERVDRALAEHVAHGDRASSSADGAQAPQVTTETSVQPQPMVDNDAGAVPAPRPRQRLASDVFDRPFDESPDDDMDDTHGHSEAAGPSVPHSDEMDVGVAELTAAHVGARAARSLGLNFRRAFDSEVPSTLLGSAEGWLPRADDGSRAETPCEPSHGVSGPAASDVHRSQAHHSQSEDSCDEPIMCFILQQFGGGAKYRRERATQTRRLVSEVFSPPRITHAMRLVPDIDLVPGFALDLTTCDPDDGMPWDFDVKAKRDKARRLLQEQRPLFIIGSPDCTAFSSWQVLNRGASRRQSPRRAMDPGDGTSTILLPTLPRPT